MDKAQNIREHMPVVCSNNKQFDVTFAALVDRLNVGAVFQQQVDDFPGAGVPSRGHQERAATAINGVDIRALGDEPFKQVRMSPVGGIGRRRNIAGLPMSPTWAR